MRPRHRERGSIYEAPQLEHEPAAAAGSESDQEMRAVDPGGFPVRGDFEKLVFGVPTGLHEHGPGGDGTGVDEGNGDLFRTDPVDQRGDIFGETGTLAGGI